MRAAVGLSAVTDEPAENRRKAGKPAGPQRLRRYTRDAQ